MRVLVIGLVVALALLVVVGYTGAFHPAGDSFAVFRLPLVVLLALTVIWTPWSRRIRWTISGLCLIILGQAAWNGVERHPSSTDLTLLQHNILFKRQGGEDWLGYVTAVNPDVLTLQEVSVANLALVDQLSESYPYRQHCPFRSHLGETVLSRYPKIEGTGFCSTRDGLAGMRVETPKGPVWIVSLHVSWPWPYGQAPQITQILPHLEKLDGPVILAGDFNAVAWSHAVDRVGSAFGGTRMGAWVNTFDLPKIGLPVGIDHVLATPEHFAVSVTAQPRLGSDHKGLLARVTFLDDN